jgi:hypothetical protein
MLLGFYALLLPEDWLDRCDCRYGTSQPMPPAAIYANDFAKCPLILTIAIDRGEKVPCFRTFPKQQFAEFGNLDQLSGWQRTGLLVLLDAALRTGQSEFEDSGFDEVNVAFLRVGTNEFDAQLVTDVGTISLN